jgi:hypothetical protein
LSFLVGGISAEPTAKGDNGLIGQMDVRFRVHWRGTAVGQAPMFRRLDSRHSPLSAIDGRNRCVRFTLPGFDLA